MAFPPNPTAVKNWGAMVAFFERAFEWENMMYTYYPYFWGRQAKWGELILIQDTDPQFEAFLKAGAARVVVPVRPGFEAALAHYQETGDVWMGEEIPDMFSDYYVSIIDEIKAAQRRARRGGAASQQWDVKLAHHPGDAQGGRHAADVDADCLQPSRRAVSRREVRICARRCGRRRTWFYETQLRRLNLEGFRAVRPDQPGPLLDLISEQQLHGRLSRAVRPAERPWPGLPRQPAAGVDG